MKPTQTKPLCSRCGNAESVISMDCIKCHYTALVMIYVHKCYRAEELDAFRDEIRVRVLDELIKSCPDGKWMTRRIFVTIRSFAHPSSINREDAGRYPSKMHEDDLKRTVCDEISRYLGAMKGVSKYEADNGEGSYMRAWIKTVGLITNGERVNA